MTTSLERSWLQARGWLLSGRSGPAPDAISFQSSQAGEELWIHPEQSWELHSVEKALAVELSRDETGRSHGDEAMRERFKTVTAEQVAAFRKKIAVGQGIG